MDPQKDEAETEPKEATQEEKQSEIVPKFTAAFNVSLHLAIPCCGGCELPPEDKRARDRQREREMDNMREERKGDEKCQQLL